MSLNLRGPSAGTYERVGYPRSAGAFTGLMNTLVEGVESCALVIQGDSTGYTVGKTRWPELVSTWAAQRFPTYGVQRMVWDDTATQAYGAPVVVQAPPNGARYINGTGANCSAVHPGYGRTVPVNGQVDIRVKFSMDSWANNVQSNLLNRSQLSTGVRCIQVGYKPGALTYSLSPDGTTTALNTQSNGVPPITLTDGQPCWFRVVINPNAGGSTASFTTYQSSDATNDPTKVTGWQAVGTVVTGAYTPGSVYEGVGGVWDYEILARQNSVNPLAGKVYAVSFIDVTSGLNLIPAVPDAYLGGSGTIAPTYGGSPMLTIVNGSAPGRDTTYLSDATRLPKMTPYDWNPLAVILNCSHNDGLQRGAGYVTKWDTWLAALRTRLPLAGISLTTQNPKTSPATNMAHKGRLRDLMVWAYRNNLSVIDAYRAFIESPVSLTSLVDQTDGIHPSDATGSPLWAATVEAALLGRS